MHRGDPPVPPKKLRHPGRKTRRPSENIIALAKQVLQLLESGYQPDESVKEVSVVTSVSAKTRKKPRSDNDAGQMVLFG
jgi:hypothetical protein